MTFKHHKPITKEVLQEQLVSMAKHHFRAGFGRQPLPIQEGAIPLEKNQHQI